MAETIPSSTRSKQAIAKVTAALISEFESNNLNFGNPVYIRTFKQEAELEIWVKKAEIFTLLKKYPICTYGFGGLGPKQQQGDGMAPEGFYFVTPKQLNPYSSYHLSFNLGYPNAYDRSHNRTGSALMVHGNCVSVGCYAMTDAKIEEIYAIVNAAFEQGQSFIRVHAFPFRMTDENMLKHKESKWIDFWANLKQGYDLFEKNNYKPPNVTVKNKTYVFN
jgi:murein L,D-transpeptidase YafK